MIGVYKIENKINSKLYIGMTSMDIEKRLMSHKSSLELGKHHNKHLQASFSKYGKDVFSFEMLEECYSLEEALDREVFWIAELETTNSSKGYNKTFGGDIPVFTEEMKKNISKSLMGHSHSEETRKKISENHADVSGRNNPMYGVPCTEENKEKLRKLHFGTKRSLETKQKMSKSYRYDLREKPVLQYTKEGVFVKRWKSCTIAARELDEMGVLAGGNLSASIPGVCRGTEKGGYVAKTAGGFMWRHCDGKPTPLFIEAHVPVYNGTPPSRAKSVLQYTISGEFVRRYESAMKASSVMGVKSGAITSACRGLNKTSCGYVWKYEEEV